MERPLAMTAVLIINFAIRSPKAKMLLKRLLKIVHVALGAVKIAYFTPFYDLIIYCSDYWSNHLLNAVGIKGGKFKVWSHLTLHFYSISSGYVGWPSY